MTSPKSTMMLFSRHAFLLILVLPLLQAFLIQSVSPQSGSLAYQKQPTKLNVFDPSTDFIGLETFDGSLVDPVIVSDVFWASVRAKILSLIIGQVLATVVFGIAASVAAEQLSKLGDYVSSTIFKKDTIKTAADSIQATVQSPDFAKLLLCLAIDIIGSSSELIPVLGEATDFVWAPIAATALRSLFGSNVVFVLEFVEEILPFTDFLPLATICWVLDTFFSDSSSAKLLRLRSSRQVPSDDAIDVDFDADKQ